MSVDISIEAGCCGSHSFNLTYNYSPALRAAGAPAWQLMDGLQADIVGILLGRVVIELDSDQARYEPQIKGGGEWGNWEHLLTTMREIVAACDKHPSGTVRCGC